MIHTTRHGMSQGVADTRYGSPLLTADQGYIILPHGEVGNSAAQVVDVAGKVNAAQIVLPFQMKVSDVQIVVTTGVEGKKIGCGIYSADKSTLLLETGAIIATSAGKKKATLATPVTLDAGVYWFAWTADDTALKTRCPSPGSWYGIFDDTVPQMGTSSETAPLPGTLPATLGTITFAFVPLPMTLMKP